MYGSRVDMASTQEAFTFVYSASTGQGTVTRFPQLTQVASRKYQTNSYSSKDAITLKTCDPQGHTWIGPSCLKSVPKGSGRASWLRRNDCSVSRRSQRLVVPYQLLRPFRAPTCLIRLTAHMVVAGEGVAGATRRSNAKMQL